MEDTVTIALDSTVRSQNSSRSKDSINSEIKPESCLESKHSKDVLIPEKQQQHQPPKHAEDRQNLQTTSETKDDSNLLMFTSCGQLLLGKFLDIFMRPRLHAHVLYFLFLNNFSMKFVILDETGKNCYRFNCN